VAEKKLKMVSGKKEVRNIFAKVKICTPPCLNGHLSVSYKGYSKNV